jgi:LytR cell envelope-related transcriptional attenuator
MLPPPREPWYRRLAASPRYLTLAIAGVLIVGGGAAFGMVQLVGDDAGDTTGQHATGGGAGGGPGGNDDGNRGAAGRGQITPANVTVAVLNGTTVPGLAASIGDRVEQLGFQLGTVANGPDQDRQRAESVVMFAPGAARAAAVVSRRLGIPQRERIDAESQGLAGDATVVVIAGADKIQ